MKKSNSKFKYLSLFPVLFLLCSCDINDYLNIGDTISNNIFPNLWDFLVQFIAFLIMIALVIVFAYKPIKAYLNKRKELLNNEVKETKEKNKEAELNLEKSKKEIASVKDKASTIIENAKVEANKEKERIINEANIEAKSKIDKADEIIKQNVKTAKKDIKNELGDVALDLSKKILEREVNEDDNKKIIDDFIKELDK